MSWNEWVGLRRRVLRTEVQIRDPWGESKTGNKGFTPSPYREEGQGYTVFSKSFPRRHRSRVHRLLAGIMDCFSGLHSERAYGSPRSLSGSAHACTVVSAREEDGSRLLPPFISCRTGHPHHSLSWSRQHHFLQDSLDGDANKRGNCS